MENNINEIFNQKDKRISYLSILHSLAILHQGQNLEDSKLSEFATKLTDALFIKYPVPGEEAKPINGSNSMSGEWDAKNIKVKLCPVPGCGKPMIRQFNKKNPKSPDWKCSDKKCKFKRAYDGGWRKSDFITGEWDEKPEDKARANHQDDIDDQAHNQPPAEYGGY